MSATDELRRMLDERGVAHSDHYLSTTWRDDHGTLHLADERADGSLVVDMLTPEQAIAATLRGEKMWAVKTWSDLDDWGVSYTERTLYRSKEEAELRAEEVRGESCDELWYDAMVVEFEVAE